MSKKYESKFVGLSYAYAIFNILQYVNPALVMIFTFIAAAPTWSMATGGYGYGSDGAILMWFGQILAGAFFAFLAWLFTVIYKDVILLFVQMGKDVNKMQKKMKG